MKKIVTGILFCVTLSAVQAQQDAQFTQNMFNRLAVNPAYAGSSKMLCATLLGRNQWSNAVFSGAPNTYLLSIDAPVKALHGGLGLNVMQDELGQEKNLIANLSYAFRMPLGPGEISFGLNGGIINKTIGNDWIATDDASKDATIPNSGLSDLTADVGVGLYYNISEQMYFGVSSTHIPTTSLTYKGMQGVDSAIYQLKRHYYIMGGYNYAIGGNPMYELKPSIFIKSTTSVADIDLNLNFLYNKMFWGGVTYRMGNALAFLTGFQKEMGNGAVKIGYSYDLGIGDIKNSKHKGSHEIMLGYCLKLQSSVKPEKHHNVRFL